jgi:hypothetical protein
LRGNASSLSRSLVDRIFVGLMGLIFAPLSGFILYVRYSRGDPAEGLDWFMQLLIILALQFFAFVFIGSVLSIVWALFTPDWIEQRLHREFRRFGRLVLVIAFLLTGAYVWYRYFNA